MSSLPRVQIKRLLAEFVVIVVGVLVALAADEWMEEREVAKAERAYLEAVDEELWALIGNWDFGRRLAADRARDLRAFEEELAMGASPDTTAGFSTDLAYVMRGTSLISSAGDVDGPILDRNPELRSALLQLASRADEAARAHGLQLGAQMSISSELDHAFSDVSAGQPVADLLREMRKFPQEARPYVRRMRRIHLNQDGRLGTLASNAEQIAERIGRILGTYQAEQVVMDGVQYRCRAAASLHRRRWQDWGHPGLLIRSRVRIWNSVSLPSSSVSTSTSVAGLGMSHPGFGRHVPGSLQFLVCRVRDFDLSPVMKRMEHGGRWDRLSVYWRYGQIPPEVIGSSTCVGGVLTCGCCCHGSP